MEEYVAGLRQACPADMAEAIMTLDLRPGAGFHEANKVLREIEKNPDCHVALVRFLAARYLRTPDPQLDRQLIHTALDVPADRIGETAPEMRRVLEMIDVQEDDGRVYFYALQTYGLDLRERYFRRYPPGSVVNFRGNAINFYLYAADLGDATAMEELDRAVKAAEPDQAQLVGMLYTLSELRKADASSIFRRYLNDQRRGPGKSGMRSGSTVASIAARGLKVMELRPSR